MLFIFSFLLIGKFSLFEMINVMLKHSIFVFLLSISIKIYKNKIKNTGLKVIEVIILLSIDQIIKIILINSEYIKFQILKNTLYFETYFNKFGSFFGALFNYKFNNLIVVIIISLIFLIFVEIFRFVKKYNKMTGYFYISFTFIFTGLISSLSDKIFYKETIDYIYFFPLFHCDLKDLYLLLFIPIILVEFLTNESARYNLKSRASIKELFCFIEKDIKYIFTKLKIFLDR